MDVGSKATEISNSRLVEDIRDGNKDAESKLVAKFQRGVFFILHRQLEDKSIAEDLTQETFLVVLSHLREGKLQNAEALPSYIRQTAINLLIALKRKEARRNTFSTDCFDSLPPSSNKDISDDLHHKKLIEITQKLIDELSVERDKQILRQFFVYHKSKLQICESFDLNSEHFDRVLHRARQRLIKLINDYSGAQNLSAYLMALVVITAIALFFLNVKLQPTVANFDGRMRDNSSLTHFIDHENGHVSRATLSCNCSSVFLRNANVG